MKIVSTNLNSYQPGLTEAIENKDAEKITSLAKQVEAAGADYIEVDAPKESKDPAGDLKWVVQTVQKAVDTPLVICWSGKEGSLKEVLPIVKTPGIINGVCTKEMADEVFPIMKDLGEGWQVIINTLHDDGQEAGQTLISYQPIIREGELNGIMPERMIFDPCINPLTEHPEAYLTMEEFIDAFSNDYRDSDFIVEPYMVTKGIDKPEMLKIAFLTLAMGLGVEYIKADVLDADIKDVYFATQALFDEENGLKDYEEHVK